jgi:hypothetical protein
VVSGSVASMFVAVQGCEVSWENILLGVKNDKKREPRNRLNFTRTYVSFMFPVADTLCSMKTVLPSSVKVTITLAITIIYRPDTVNDIIHLFLSLFLILILSDVFFLFNVLFFPNTLYVQPDRAFFCVQNQITFHLRSLGVHCVGGC